LTDQATIARENALHCEAKKHAYRQTQDGVVVSFVLHPQDLPDGLATAALGTRYMLALVEIGDDEKPVKQPAQNKTVQRAAVLCTDKEFQSFLRTTQPSDWNGVEGDDETKAAAVLRRLCEVQSRKELATDHRASAAFESLLTRFEGWRRGY
jgi:hypothetical protein